MPPDGPLFLNLELHRTFADSWMLTLDPDAGLLEYPGSRGDGWM